MKVIHKNKNTRKVILIGIFLCFLLEIGFLYSSVKADSTYSENNVIFLNDKGEKSAALFNECDGLWGPGTTKSKKFFMENTSRYDFTFENLKVNLGLTDFNNIKIEENNKIYGEFLKSINLVLSDESGVLYEGRFIDLFHGINVNGLKITVPANSKKLLNIKLTMDKSSGNSLQALIGKSEISVVGHSIGNGNGGETLVQTGSILDFKMLIGIGMVIFLVGLFILIKKKKA
jgi:hypothetical protein